MLFSIIVPVYNVEQYIEKCINSVIAQTYSEWELILIDDGSIDKSAEICQRYVKRDKRIHLYKKENTGQADCRNIGVAKAKGDYLLFVDSDDYIDSRSLEYAYNACIKWPNVEVILSEGMYEVFGEKEIPKFYWCANDYQGMTGRDVLLHTMPISANWSPCGKIYRTIYWRDRKFTFLKNRLAEDFELIDRVILEARCVVMIAGFYYYRRFRENSTMTRPNKKLKQDELLNFASWEKYFKENHIEKDAELINCFRSRFANSFCHNILATLYLFNADEQKELIPQIRNFLFYLDYNKSKEIKLIRIGIKMFGLRTVCFLLGRVKQYRINKERKRAGIR